MDKEGWGKLIGLPKKMNDFKTRNMKLWIDK